MVLPAVLAELAPRVRVEPERVWVDARGLPAEDLAADLLQSLAALGVEDARAGVSDVAVAAWAACSGFGARTLASAGGQEAPGRGTADAMTHGRDDTPNPGTQASADAMTHGRDDTPNPGTPAASADATTHRRDDTPDPGTPAASADATTHRCDDTPDAGTPAVSADATTHRRDDTPDPGTPASADAMTHGRDDTPNPGTPAVSADGSPGAEDARVGASARRRVGASVFIVPPGREREYLCAFPLAVLAVEHADPHVLGMLEGVGVQTCGQLAALEREAVEVRFGTEGVRLWRLARSDDPRLLFQAAPPELPQASLDFLDYVVTDPERLAFTVNALLGSVCDALRERGQHARRMLLVLELSGGGRWEQGLRPGRPTGSRTVWLRLARAALDRSTLGDAVAGVGIEVEAVEPAGVRQGDLFDAGFATAPAVEAAVLRLLESQGEVVVRPEADAHPLAERRVSWRPVTIDEVASIATAPPTEPPRGAAAGGTMPAPSSAATATEHRSWAAGLPRGGPEAAVSLSRHPTVEPSGMVHPSAIVASNPVPRAMDEPTAALTLQLLKQPRAVRVETVLRRDHEVPIRYRDDIADATGGALPGGGLWHQVVSVAGPDRVSGGVWEEAYAREYFRATTADGALVWLFRDARRGAWYLHGWWD